MSIRLARAVRPVLLLVAVMAALDTGFAADLGRHVLEDSLSQSCCTAPALTTDHQGLVEHLNDLNALTRRFADVGGISLPNG